MKLAKNIEAEVGPAVLVDREYLPRLKALGEKALFGGGLELQADLGICCWLRCEGMREFIGQVEVCVEEPGPEAAQAVTGSKADLWLRVPTGKLVLESAGNLIASRPEAPLLELEVPPGEYRVDLATYETPEQRLEREPPDRAEPGRLASAFIGVGCLFALITAVLVVCVGILAFEGEWGAARWPAFGIALLWIPFVLLYRLTGAGAQQKAAQAAFDEAIARMPREPDFRLVLRKRESDSTDSLLGGGLVA